MPKSGFKLSILMLSFFVLMCLVVPGMAAADIGSGGGTTTLKSDIEMMSGVPVHGGGHFTWIVSGAAARELRGAIILNYDAPHGVQGPDGTLQTDEVNQYALDLERYLEDESQDHSYMGANLRRFALLNRDVTDDTKGLIGTSNASTNDIEIRMYFDAWMPSGETDVELTNTRILDAIYYVVNETYVEPAVYEIEHTEYMVSVGDFSNFDISKGTIYLIRTPFGDIYHYRVSFKAGPGNNPDDKILYEPFNWIECPLILFVAMAVLGYFVVTMPGRFRRYDVTKNVKVHTLAKALLVILILLYLFAGIGQAFIQGAYIWILGVVFLFISLVVSKMVYERAERITTLPEKPVITTKDKIPDEELEEAPLGQRNVQCVTCGEIFGLSESSKGDSAPCPACGSIGAVEFARTEEEIPPEEEDFPT